MFLYFTYNIYLLDIFLVSSPPSEPNLPPESKLVRSEFAAFLSSRLDRQGVVQVSRQTKTLIDKIQAEAEGAEVENCVQEFYRQFDKLLQVEPAFKGKYRHKKAIRSK